MSDGYGLYIHHDNRYLLGRTASAAYNNKIKTIKNDSVSYYTDFRLREIGWIKVAPITLSGWDDE